MRKVSLDPRVRLSSTKRLEPSARRRARQHLLDLSERQHPLDLALDLWPVLVPQQLPHDEREHVPRASLPPDPPVRERVPPALPNVDHADRGTLLLRLADEAERGEGREGGAGDEELRRRGDEVLREATREGFERLAEEDDALGTRWRE